MPRFNLFLFSIAIVFFAYFGQSVCGQNRGAEKPVYTEIEEYHRTLTPERQKAYEAARAQYINQPPATLPLTSNPRLAESYTNIMAKPETDAANVSDKIAALQKLSVEAARKKATYLELECLYRAFMLAFWSDYRDYFKGFELALVLEEKLSEVTERGYPDRRNAYFRISEAYYLFKNYNKSIELALQAITDQPPRSFTDRANLEGRKILAMAYGMVGDFDRSDEVIRSTWQSGDMVEGRPVFNAMALAHMACNEMDRGNWRKALALNGEVLEYLKTTGDPGHVAGMYACQSFCYYGLGEPEKIGAIADSMLHYATLDRYNRNKRLKQAYTNLSRYNGVIGNIPAMQQYQDSLVAIYRREDDAAASQYISQARQGFAHNKIQEREENLKRQRAIIAAVTGVLVLTLFFLTIILRLYRRQQAAYKALAEKARAWAETGAALKVYGPGRAGSADASDSGNPTRQENSREVREIAERLQDYMASHKPYRDPELTLDGLARVLGMTRNKLSEAVNSASGKSFKLYINDLRVMEALRLMNANPPSCLSMEQLMERVGFNGRSTFYNSFKTITGLTPAQYWKNIDYGKKS